MMRKYYRFAGMEFAVELPAELMYENDHRLAPFRVESAEAPTVFRFYKKENLSPPEGNCLYRQPDLLVYEEARYWDPVDGTWESAHFRVSRGEEGYKVQLRADAYHREIGARTALDAFGVEHHILRRDGVLFHCSCIEHGGKAIMFTAPSQTGKSTQAELWKQHRGAAVINGDRAALRFVNGTLLAEGIPFCGSSDYCENRSLPVEAIVYLGQAPVTTIRKLRGYEAFSRIWEGITVNTWDRKDMELASDIVSRIAAKVPVWHMPCTPDEAAVKVLEDALKKEM